MKKPLIEVDPGAGFCFGVEQAIEKAESLLNNGETVFSLGHMVHNPVEVDRLSDRGLRVVRMEDLENLKNARVLFRAHGEPPSSYRMVEKYGIELIDATCPIVSKLQQRIRKKYQELDPSHEQIVLFGKENHPETIGLLGQTDNTAVLITDPEDLSPLEKGKKIFLYSQTTMDPGQFDRLEDNLKNNFETDVADRVESHCTICGQMKRRKPELKKFISDKDLVFFISGKDSSNGKMLFNFCRRVNKNTHWIEEIDDIDLNLLKEKSKIGISGATSTPAWQLEKAKEYIESVAMI